MSRVAHKTEDFGPRLRRLRKERGWTQGELAEQIGSTVRAIFYYEREGRYPPAPVLADLADTFGVSMEALLGRVEIKSKNKTHDPNLLEDPEDRKLWRKFRQLKDLPVRDKQMVMRMVNNALAAVNS